MFHLLQVPTDWVRRHIMQGGYWMSKLYFNGDDAGVNVWVVISIETVKLSAGFTDFMKNNGIKKRDSLRFGKK